MSGITAVLTGQPTSLGAAGISSFNEPQNGMLYSHAAATSTQIRARWRASKGSAPVGRFTRSFGDNTTEGWHRTMPIATSTTVTVPVAALVLAALVPTVTPGAVTLTVPVTTVGLLAVAPTVSTGMVVAVPATTVTMVAVAPAVTGTVTVAVPTAQETLNAISPTVSSSIAVAVPASSVSFLAVAPQISAVNLVQIAVTTWLAVAPSVTGGGGGGGTNVALRKSGD